MSDNEDLSVDYDDSGSDIDDYHLAYAYGGFRGDDDDFEGGDNDDDDDDDGDDYFTWASAVPRLCAQLRTNDPSVLLEGPNEVFQPDVPDSYRLEIAEALVQNIIVRRINLEFQDYSKLSTDSMAKYLAQSKHLMAVELSISMSYYDEMELTHQRFLSTFIEAIGQSNSVKELSLTNLSLGAASDSFENLLTRTKTLQNLRVDLETRGPMEEAATAAFVSGFSKNTTLSEIVLLNWPETSLIPVLAALRDHPMLEKLQVELFLSFNGIDVLVGSKQSQLKELIFVGLNVSTAEGVTGFESFMQEMGRNITILKIGIIGVGLRRDNIQQLKAMLRQNTVLQDLDLRGSALGSTGLPEIASALYRNTSIKHLDVSANDLDDLVAANALRELLRRNKTITQLCMDRNGFGSNVAVVRCLADGFRANTTLQVLNLSACQLDDQGLSILAEGLGQQKRDLAELILSSNQITCSGLRALLDKATAALSTVTKLDLSRNSFHDEGASFLAETLRRQTLPSLKCLQLDGCSISDDGFAALVSALEENETLETINFKGTGFSARGYLALASSLPNIKGLRKIDFSLATTDPSVLPALKEGFRKNTSLHDVNIAQVEHGKWSQELSFLLYRNKFSRLLQDSDTDDCESLGLWSRALGSVATRPDVLFHVLTSKAGLIRATPGEDSNKRKRDDSEYAVMHPIT